jgi:hypothetical protein
MTDQKTESNDDAATTEARRRRRQFERDIRLAIVLGDPVGDERGTEMTSVHAH